VAASETSGRPRRQGSLLLPFVALVVAFGVSIVSLDVAAVLTHTHPPSSVGSLTVPLLAADELGLWVVFVGSAILGAHLVGREPFVRFVRLSLRPVDLPVGILLGVLGQLVLVPVLYLPIEAADPRVRAQLSKPAVQLLGVGVGHDLGAVVAIIVIGAPICEEIFFRGLVLRSVALRAARWPRPLRASVPIAVSALLFAIAHFEPLQFLGLLAFGVVLAIAAWRTGRLGTSIVAHAAFNLTAVVALLGVASFAR
jgi:membrane protease YdiL (CAAX protease family)